MVAGSREHARARDDERDSGRAARHRGAEAATSSAPYTGRSIRSLCAPPPQRKAILATSIRSASTTHCSRRCGHEHAAARSDQGVSRELRLTALPDIYGAIAQAAAKRKDASYADFLEEVLRAERDARRVRGREMLTRTAGFPAQKTLEATRPATTSPSCRPRQNRLFMDCLAFQRRIAPWREACRSSLSKDQSKATGSS